MFLPLATTYMAGEHLCLVKIKSAGAKLLVEETAMFVAGQYLCCNRVVSGNTCESYNEVLGSQIS